MPRGGRRVGAGRKKGTAEPVGRVVREIRNEVKQEVLVVTKELVLADLEAMRPIARSGYEALLAKPSERTVLDWHDRMAGKAPQPVHMTGGVPAITIVMAIPRPPADDDEGTDGN